MFFKFVLIFLSVEYLNAQVSICSYENNIDFASSVTLTYLYSAGPQLCCALCGYRTECLGFSYQSINGICFLKSAINLASRTYSNGRTSGIKVQVRQNEMISLNSIKNTTISLNAKSYKCYSYPNVNFEGNDLTQLFVDDEAKCCEACTETPGCKTWTFITNYKFCMLKKSVANTKEIYQTSNTISGAII